MLVPGVISRHLAVRSTGENVQKGVYAYGWSAVYNTGPAELMTRVRHVHEMELDRGTSGASVRAGRTALPAWAR